MTKDQKNSFNLVCPPIIRDKKNITLGHGGGLLTHELINTTFKKILTNPAV